MVNDKTKTMANLYQKVLPALRSKRKELQTKNLGFITEKEIWDYLRLDKWPKEGDLTLFDIVDDILNMKEEDLLEYKKRKEVDHK